MHRPFDLKTLVRKAKAVANCFELRRAASYTDIEELINNESKFTVAGWVYWYATEVVKGRWREAELFLLGSSRYACMYCQYIGRPIPRLEVAILEDPIQAARYAHLVLKRPWPDAEQIILNNPIACVYYCRWIKGHWPEAAEICLKSAKFTYQYAAYVLQKPWAEAEYVLKYSAHFGRLYAQHVLKGRFIEAETVIESSPLEWKLYWQFLKMTERI